MPRLGNQFQLIIFDECHHLPGPIRRDAARMSVAPMRLGLTATPERSDGRHVDLESLIGPIVYELKLSEVKGQALADYDVVRIPVHLSENERERYESLSRQVRYYIQQQRQFVEAHPQLDMIYFPPGCPDLNPQEHVWKKVRDAVGHLGNYRHIGDLRKAFQNHLDSTFFNFDWIDKYLPKQLCQSVSI